MDYLTTAEAAEKWGLSRRRVYTLCSEGRIPGATRLGTTWAIPKNAKKPADARIKNGRYIGQSEQRRKAKADRPAAGDAGQKSRKEE